MTLVKKGLGISVLLAAIILAIWHSKEKPSAIAEKSTSPPPTRARTTRPDPEDERSVANANVRRRTLDDWKDLLQWLRTNPPPTAVEVRDRLLATRTSWATMDPQALAAAIQQLLETGDDATTGLDFKVGIHGLLTGWPSLRVFLLDVLATSDPEMAMSISNKLLDQTTSPDEFATALRSQTRTGIARAGDGELLARFGQMLDHADWQTSRGFAEAFDLARFIGTPEAARQLVAWDGNPALKSMAMDEFAAEHPREMLEILGSESTLEGLTSARLMARADPSDPQQLSSVDAYFRSPDRTPEEIAAFLKSFPLRSATTGYRLYGRTPSPYTYEQIKAGDRAANDLANSWTNDPSLDQYRPEIQSLQNRLSKWIEQTK
ncbi:MAG: hypothetical protein V4584_15205 [Verrucomicrobiota bacterium]